MKRNKPVLGLIIGLLLPLVGIGIMYFAWSREVPFPDYARSFFSHHDMAAKVLSLSILLNVIPFIYYTSKRLDLTARGLLIATVLYALVIILLRFVWI